MPPTVSDNQVSNKHTPGPWTFETVRTSVGICHKIGAFPTGLAHRPEGYACVYEDGMSKQLEWDRGTLNSELFANARLIAAAPELLAALAAVVLEIYNGMTDSYCEACSAHAEKEDVTGRIIGPIPHKADCVYQRAIAALAKAEGR